MFVDAHGNPSAGPGSRWSSILLGIAVGLVVGLAWTALFGPLTDGPPSLKLSLSVYTIGFSIAGAIVGAVRKFPEVVGLAAGSLTLSVVAVIVGPKDGWIVMWVMMFGGSGLLCGAVIGALYRLVKARTFTKPAAAERQITP
jgi:hypothetical protein